jgi:serine protease
VQLLLAVSWLALAGCSIAGAQAAPTTGNGDWLTADQTPLPPTGRPPDDPLFRYQWHLPAIQAPSAWTTSRGEGVTVAVLDTGVAYEDRGPYRRAPDLAGTRFVAGWDFVDDDAHPNDVPPADGRRSHGTQIAGLIAQTADNAIGGAGVAPAATIMPIRVLRPDRTGSARDIAQGLRFAADHGADVVNLSIAGPSQTQVVKDAIRYAAAKGVTMVAAVGNDGLSTVGWPAADPRVIAVGATGQDLTRARYSNYGKALDLVAPAGAGELVDSGPGPGDGVLAQTVQGRLSNFCFCFTASTSAAAAQVSGVVALLVGANPGKDPAEIRAALLSGARDLGPRGWDTEYGAGLVQAWRSIAITRAVSTAVPPSPRVPSSPGPSRNVWLISLIFAASLVGLLALVSTFVISRGRESRR